MKDDDIGRSNLQTLIQMDAAIDQHEMQFRRLWATDVEFVTTLDNGQRSPSEVIELARRELGDRVDGLALALCHHVMVQSAMRRQRDLAERMQE